MTQVKETYRSPESEVVETGMEGTVLQLNNLSRYGNGGDPFNNNTLGL